MGENLQIKQKQVEDLQQHVNSAQSIIVAHYRGLSVTEVNELRKRGREEGVWLKIVKNTLARRALVNSQFAGLSDYLLGPVILAMSTAEPNAAAKLLQDFSREHSHLKVQVIGLGSDVLEASSLAAVAKMPNHQQAIVLILGVLQAPVRNLACTLQETYAKLARTVQAVAKQKESQ